MICRTTAEGIGYEQLLAMLLEENLRVIKTDGNVSVLTSGKHLHGLRCTQCEKPFFHGNRDATVWMDRRGDDFAVHCDGCKSILDEQASAEEAEDCQTVMAEGEEQSESGLVSHRSHKRLRRKGNRSRQTFEEYVSYLDDSRGRRVRIKKMSPARSPRTSRR